MKEHVAILKALADKTRLRIIRMLYRRPHCVEEITTRLKMSQPRVSRHLRILRESGLVTTERDRRRVYYSLSEEATRAVAEMIGFLEGWLGESPAGVRPSRAPRASRPEPEPDLPGPSVGEIEDFLL